MGNTATGCGLATCGPRSPRVVNAAGSVPVGALTPRSATSAAEDVDRQIVEARQRRVKLDEELAELCERRRELSGQEAGRNVSPREEEALAGSTPALTRSATRKSLTATRGKQRQSTLIARTTSSTFSRVMAKHVTVREKLGEGSFGAVYRGEWRGIPLALKFLTNAAKDDMEECLEEVQMLDTLEHPNVIRVYGLCVGDAPAKWPSDAKPPCIASELMSHGTFIDYFAKVPLQSRCALDHWIKVIGMLKGAANGLGYLHSMGVLHCDLKGENLLLDAEDCLKLADFGLAMARDKIPTRSEAIGTYTHMAPEVMKSLFDQWDTCSDIFSFGICITEAIAGICSSEVVGVVAEDIIEQTRTKDFGLNEEGIQSFINSQPNPPVSQQLCNIAFDCCALDHTDRPSAFGLIAKLEAMEDVGIDIGEENDYRIASLRARRDKLMNTLKLLEKSEAQAKQSNGACAASVSADAFDRSIGRSKHILHEVQETNVKLSLVKKVRKAVQNAEEEQVKVEEQVKAEKQVKAEEPTPKNLLRSRSSPVHGL